MAAGGRRRAWRQEAPPAPRVAGQARRGQRRRLLRDWAARSIQRQGEGGPEVRAEAMARGPEGSVWPVTRRDPGVSVELTWVCHDASTLTGVWGRREAARCRRYSTARLRS